jgi:hypothetical protein
MPLHPRALLLLAAFLPLTTPAQQPPAAVQTISITPTLSLGDPLRATKLEADDPEIIYRDGFFISFDGPGRVRIRDKDGRLTSDFVLRPQEKETATALRSLHDIAVFQDGSIVASWVYMLPHDGRRYLSLVHYGSQGNFLESIDLGQWRALKVCIAGDKSIWTLSSEEWFGRPVYSPAEGVLRNYKFGTGLVRAVVPRSNFQPDNTSTFPSYQGPHAAIDCSGDKIHALTGDGQWIEYTPGADFTITPIEPFSHSTFGDFWQLTGFAFLDSCHAYAVIHSVPGDPFRRMFAELFPSPDGKTLHWVELRPGTLPADNHPSPTPHPPGQSTDQSPDQPTSQPKEPIAVTGLLGADHGDGEQLLYRTSKDDSILWSKPLFGNSQRSAQ